MNTPSTFLPQQRIARCDYELSKDEGCKKSKECGEFNGYRRARQSEQRTRASRSMTDPQAPTVPVQVADKPQVRHEHPEPETSMEAGRCGSGTSPRSVTLPVLQPPTPGRGTKPAGQHGTIKKSRAGKWRAIVLVLVNVVIGIHILQWLYHGMTLSPVEPSEAMYTLEFGQVNAGFVFFILALLSTFIFGRFFCGWGCHVVSLQDLCSHWMTKLGVRPKPFRSRFLILAPLLLGSYMFLWPTFKREALFPALELANVTPPVWLSPPVALTGFTNNFMVKDFWATFPPWYIAIPFLLVCGFVCVYLLGSKGFCTYGCPYGGFFAPLDKISIGRIVVSDACEGCGHCTAVCTSNVRVHQEVKEYGKVVDPGCMKCMDCVSVCPNGALSFSFAKPALFTALRAPTTPSLIDSVLAGKPTEKVTIEATRPKYDLKLWQDAVIFLVGLGFFFGLRGTLDSIPLLMAAGLAAIGAFGAAKVWQSLLEPSVRAQNLQLKIKGKITLSGVAFSVMFAAYAAFAIWGAAVNYSRWRGDLLDAGISTPFAQVFSAEYKPTAGDTLAAEQGLAYLERGGARADSPHGFGWKHQPKTLVRMSWLAAVAGDRAEAERYLRLAIDRGDPSADWVFGLARLLILQGRPQDGPPMYEQVLTQHPQLHDVRLSLAVIDLQNHNGQRAIERVEEMLRLPDVILAPNHVLRAVEILIDSGRPGRALEVAKDYVVRSPQAALVHAALATAESYGGDPSLAIAAMERASELAPENPAFLARLVQMYEGTGNMAKLEGANNRLRQLEEKAQAGRRDR